MIKCLVFPLAAQKCVCKQTVSFFLDCTLSSLTLSSYHVYSEHGSDVPIYLAANHANSGAFVYYDIRALPFTLFVSLFLSFFVFAPC